MAEVNKPVVFDDDEEAVAALKDELEALRAKIKAGVIAAQNQKPKDDSNAA